jgi:hypothetical protein
MSSSSTPVAISNACAGVAPKPLVFDRGTHSVNHKSCVFDSTISSFSGALKSDDAISSLDQWLRVFERLVRVHFRQPAL